MEREIVSWLEELEGILDEHQMARGYLQSTEEDYEWYKEQYAIGLDPEMHRLMMEKDEEAKRAHDNFEWIETERTRVTESLEHAFGDVGNLTMVKLAIGACTREEFAVVVLGDGEYLVRGKIVELDDEFFDALLD